MKKLYTLKNKKLIYVPLIGFIYTIILASKHGILTNATNVNAYESFFSVMIQSFSLALILILLAITILLT